MAHMEPPKEPRDDAVLSNCGDFSYVVVFNIKGPLFWKPLKKVTVHGWPPIHSMEALRTPYVVPRHAGRLATFQFRSQQCQVRPRTWQRRPRACEQDNLPYLDPPEKGMEAFEGYREHGI